MHGHIIMIYEYIYTYIIYFQFNGLGFFSMEICCTHLSIDWVWYFYLRGRNAVEQSKINFSGDPKIIES